MALIDEVKYAQAYSFKYSPRPGTPAADSPEQVDEAVKDARLQQLKTRLAEHQRQFNEAQIGRVLPVLFEKPSKKDGQMSGRSPYLQTVHVSMDEAMMSAVRGRILPVKITTAFSFSMVGELADEDA